MTKRYALFILIVLTICWAIFIAGVLKCQGAENKKTSQMTSKELKIRKQNFQQCIDNGTPRAVCYRMYYN